MSTKSTEITAIEYSARGKIVTFIKPLVMAIVNTTPDSFYDGGKFEGPAGVLRDVEEKLELGADIIDMGAASSRPGAPEISEAEEWTRLQPNLVAVRREFPGALISVDTYRASIARQSAELGADIINDISGGDLDADMHTTVAALNLPYIIMHMPGTPQTMQQTAPYQDVVTAVLGDLLKKVNSLQGKGFQKIILDPGFGFGKSTQNNYQLLKGLDAFTETGFPVLAGVSRKSMISKVIGTNPVTALNGTTVLNTMALMNGAKILRVHDVTEARQAIALYEFYKKA